MDDIFHRKTAPGTPPEPARPATLVCARRSSGSRRIEKLGVQVDGALKHFHPTGVLFALKLGAWTLRYTPPGARGPVEVGVAHDAAGRECLRAEGAVAPDDGLRDVPACTHRTPSGEFRALE